MIETLGYAASILVALSMVMVSLNTLRIVNTAGSALFIAYGIALGSVPLILTNAFIICVNLFHLFSIRKRTRDSLEYEVAGPERDGQISDYLAARHKDIEKHQPYAHIQQLYLSRELGGEVLLAKFTGEIHGLAVWTPLANLDVQRLPNYAGLRQAVHEARQGGGALLFVDYIDKQFRNIGIGEGLHKRLDDLSVRGHSRLWALCDDSSRSTYRYLRRRGFVLTAEFGGLMLLSRDLASAGSS